MGRNRSKLIEHQGEERDGVGLNILQSRITVYLFSRRYKHQLQLEIQTKHY